MYPLLFSLTLILTFAVKIKGLDLSFSSAKALRGRVELLPSGPRWLSREVTVDGFATKNPLIVYYRDPVDCMKFLLQNPIFAGRIRFSPEHHYDISGARTYSDWITSDGAWEMQVCDVAFCKSSLTRISRIKCQLVRRFLAPFFHRTRPSSLQ